jgi:hypothetical protein
MLTEESLLLLEGLDNGNTFGLMTVYSVGSSLAKTKISLKVKYLKLD